MIALAPIGAGAAQLAARQELQKPEYHRDDPGPLSRLLSWLANRSSALFNATPGGSATLVLSILLIGLAAFAIARASTSSRRLIRAPQSGADPLRPAEFTDHAAAAQRFAADGDYALALREWLRAAIQISEGRGALDAMPGRTATEFAHTAGALMPAAREGLIRAAGAFDLVWFGGKAATPADAETGRVAAELVATAAIRTGASFVESRYLVPR